MSTKTASNRTAPPTATGFGGGGSTARARQSSRVAVSAALSDGAVWQEKLVVCEGAQGDQPVIMVRSYYRNLVTAEKVWDEPPSGAAAVVHATPEERGVAEEQRTQLELTLQMIPADTELEPYNNHGRDNNNDHHDPHDAAAMATSGGMANNKKKKGFLGRFRKGGSGGTFSSSSRRHDRVDPAKDVNLQKAIAQSIRETRGGVDDVELAMALSLSVADAKNRDLSYNDNDSDDNGPDDDDTNVAIALSTAAAPPRFEDLEPTEEELFQRALERSQREISAKRPPVTDDDNEDEDDEDLRHVLERSKNEVVRAPPVASLPKNYGDYRDESSSYFDGPPLVPDHLSEDELELKMPAKPKGMPKF